MQKYGGNLIHQSHDALGSIEVVEEGPFRSLHFGTEPKQSSMDLHDPLRLTLTYTRAMMAALLFNPAPRRALLLGLGGGSMAKFLLHYFPDCRVDVVEYRESVYKLARGYFQLPDDPRLSVQIGDAADFVREADASWCDYDLLLIDCFTGEGIAHGTAGISFFEACRSRLGPDGVLASNLWSGDNIRLEDVVQDMADTFDGGVVRLPVEGRPTSSPWPPVRAGRNGSCAASPNRPRRCRSGPASSSWSFSTGCANTTAISVSESARPPMPAG